MKKPKPQSITGTPIICMEGGNVQDVFIPAAEGSKFTSIPIWYDLVDMDVLKECSDEEIENHWNRLTPESQKYFIRHQPDTYERFKAAMGRRVSERARLDKQFTRTDRPMRAIETILWGAWVLRKDTVDGSIQTVRLIKALEQLRLALNRKVFPNDHEIVKRLAEGAVLTGGKFEFVLDPEN